MSIQSRNWCFTMNNYSSDDEERLNSVDLNIVEYLVYGREVGESGTPHLQGLVVFYKKKRMNGVLTVLGQCHVSACKNVVCSISYCKKDGDFVEVGQRKSKPTKSSDLDLVLNDIVNEGIYDIEHYMNNHASVYIRAEKWIRDMINCYRPKIRVEPRPLYLWQAKMWNTLTRKAVESDRHIYFVVDRIGNFGKTWFTKYYRQNHPNTQMIQPNKMDNMAFIVREHLDVLFVDCPRDKVEYLSYSFLEAVKSGEVMSGKYTSIMKIIGDCHVVVLMNTQPDMAKLSRDRYRIIELKEEDREVVEGEVGVYE